MKTKTNATAKRSAKKVTKPSLSELQLAHRKMTQEIKERKEKMKTPKHLKDAVNKITRVLPVSLTVEVYNEKPRLFKVGTKKTVTTRIIKYVKSVQIEEREIFEHDVVRSILQKAAANLKFGTRHRIWIGKCWIFVTFD